MKSVVTQGTVPQIPGTAAAPNNTSTDIPARSFETERGKPQPTNCRLGMSHPCRLYRSKSSDMPAHPSSQHEDRNRSLGDALVNPESCEPRPVVVRHFVRSRYPDLRMSIILAVRKDNATLTVRVVRNSVAIVRLTSAPTGTESFVHEYTSRGWSGNDRHPSRPQWTLHRLPDQRQPAT